MAGNEPSGTAPRRIHSAICANVVFVCTTLIGLVPSQLGGASLASSSTHVAVRHGLTVVGHERPAMANLDSGLLGALRPTATDAAQDGGELLVTRASRSQEALLVLAAAPQTMSTAAPVDVLNIRVYADRDTSKKLTRDATTVAERLLATAGVATRWRLCSNAAACSREGEITEPVVVIFSSSPRRGSHPTCGYATRRDAGAIGTVVISIPCIAESTARIVGSADTPLPMIRRHDDVVGAVTAHEVAHLLGVAHAEAGLMAPHLGPAEIVDLRLDRLHFTEPEAALMRTAVSRAMQAAGLGTIDHADPPGQDRLQPATCARKP
jgi:hypothetical protein